MIRALLAFPVNCIRLRSIRRALWVLDYDLAARRDA
jgi:hypothetical protein